MPHLFLQVSPKKWSLAINYVSKAALTSDESRPLTEAAIGSNHIASKCLLSTLRTAQMTGIDLPATRSH